MSDGKHWNLGPEMDQIENALENGIPIPELEITDSDPDSGAFTLY